MPRIPLRYSIPVAFPDCCGLARVDAALAFTANNDRAWGRRVVASIMSRLTSSDTCNAVFDVVHFGTYARAYAVRQASRSPTAPINGETHTQARRGVFRPTLSTLQASSQWRWSGSLRPRRQACVFGPRERVVRAEYRPAPITFPSVPGRIARCGCDRTLRLYAQAGSPGARSSRRPCPKGNER